MTDLARTFFNVSAPVAVIAGAFVFGNYARENGLAVIPEVQSGFAGLLQAVTDGRAMEHMQPARGQGSGVTVNELADAGDMILMSGYFDDGIAVRLVRRDGTLVNSWPLDYLAHFPEDQRACPVSSPLDVDAHGMTLNPAGELVLNYEHCGTVRLDACGNVVWRLPELTHHSVVPAEAGGFWALGRHNYTSAAAAPRFARFFHAADGVNIADDTVMRISEDGEVIDEFSIAMILQDQGLGAYLSANREMYLPFEGMELVHANKVTELTAAQAAAFPMFAAGDLAISSRDANFVMVIDPVTHEVKWHQTGPWLRQHDVEFGDDGLISVFNNNVHNTAYVDNQTDLSTPFTTDIVAIDPATREVRTLYGNRPGQEMLSVIRGDHQRLPNGGLLITEFDAGRVLQVNGQGRIVWEYVNALDDNYVGEMTNSTVIPADFLQSDWRSCSR